MECFVAITLMIIQIFSRLYFFISFNFFHSYFHSLRYQQNFLNKLLADVCISVSH